MCDTTASSTKRTRPRWGLLYALSGVGLALFAVLDTLSPPGGWRTLMDGFAAVVLCAAIAAWVRANRGALAQADWCACAAQQTTVRVFHPQPRVWPIAQPTKHVPLRVHQEEAACSVTSGQP